MISTKYFTFYGDLQTTPPFVIRHSFKCSCTAHIYSTANFIEVRYTVMFVLLPQNQDYIESETEREIERGDRERFAMAENV